MTLIPTAAKSARDLAHADLLALGIGVQFEPFTPMLSSPNTSPVSQNLYATALYAAAGAPITGIKLRNTAGAAGTLPALARFGLADNTGKVLALSGNVSALANWTAGVDAFPLAAPLVLAYSGIYFPCFVVNGTWGTTQPTPIRAANLGVAWAADGANPPLTVSIGAQADLPAVGAAFSLAGPPGNPYYLALY